MGWLIEVSPAAREQLNAWPLLLRLELIDCLAELAEAPAAYLSRPVVPDPLGPYAFSYDSEVLDRLRVTVYFRGLDDDPPRLQLLALRDSIGP
ncbi:MAG: hypothetical protein WEC33_05125 [Dehalococcoidia bacterium]